MSLHRRHCHCPQSEVRKKVLFTVKPGYYSHLSGFNKEVTFIQWFILYDYGKPEFKVIRHVFGFGIEFLENKDIGIFGHFIVHVIDFIKRYSHHMYFSPISTSWFCRFGTGCIVRDGEWRIIVNYSVFSALFSLKLRILFEGCILDTPVQKDAVPPIFISHYHRSKPNSTATYLCIELYLFTSH